MYKIIGADQKEYGPVSADELRQWIAQGRVNGQTPVQAEGTQGWKPLLFYPELAAGLSAGPAPAIPTPGVLDHGALPTDIAGRDYDLDIGACISRSWELVKANFWPVVGFTFLLTLVMQAVNQGLGLFSNAAVHAMVYNHEITVGGILLVSLTSILSMPVQSVIMGGLYKYYLKLIRGEDATLSDAFYGFSSAFVPLALLGLVMGLLTLVGFLFCIVPGIYLAVAWFFATALVVDKQLGFWEAMELSRKVVTKHWFMVFALMLVVGLLGASGIIACCIGVFVTLPIAWVAFMYAYEDIFGHRAAGA